jgi:F420-dependent oxidoreductase-like protein
MVKPIRFGVQTAPHNTTWKDMKAVWQLIDRLGYDTAWTFDHFFPILSDPSGPCFEGWMTLAGLAAETSRVKVGVLVTGNTYRNPAVLASMGKTLDHSSDGRLIMGIGAGWFEQEHIAYGIPFYTVGERIRRLDEAAEIIKRLWTEKQVNFKGKYYELKEAYCEPKPLQKPWPPIMIGGAGEKLTLRVVARHADIWNTFGSPQIFREKISILKEHCESVGRNLDDIEISWAGATRIAGSPAERDETIRRVAARFGRPPEEIGPGLLMGTAEEIRERINRLIEVGVTHFIIMPTSPADQDTIRRFAEEVMPGFRKK